MERRTYWCSFCDNDLPKGHRFLGVAVVDVTDDDAQLMLARLPNMHSREEGPWIAAAALICWRAHCNPGGSMAVARVDECEHPDILARIPRNRLFTKAEIAAAEASEWRTMEVQ